MSIPTVDATLFDRISFRGVPKGTRSTGMYNNPVCAQLGILSDHVSHYELLDYAVKHNQHEHEESHPSVVLPRYSGNCYTEEEDADLERNNDATIRYRDFCSFHTQVPIATLLLCLLLLKKY